MTTEQEPVYQFVRGVGWIVNNNEVVQILGVPCEVVDQRLDMNNPGVYRYQLWLVGVTTYYDQRVKYTYTDWVDSWPRRTWKTVVGVTNHVLEYTREDVAEIYKDPNFKHRIILVDE
jgi:hypothetical protein